MRPALIILWTLTLSGSLFTFRETQASGDFQPDSKSVQRHGPAYRYPQAGWIVLHIEGEPYERGYQHGRLLAPEIAGYLRCFAALQSPKAPTEGWKTTRSLVNALFVRRFDQEYLEEMKGIADGATAAGARFDDRPIDLVDIVGLNCWAEIETLESALEATPTGLEGIRFPRQQPRITPPPKPNHCSAFAATGPATADGKIVFGHITMFSLYPALFYNVWLDVKPARGHRVLMQSYPGGIQSGMDYYLNDAGLLVSETTIAQTRFDSKGMSLTSRIRQALQYADSIDGAVAILQKGNNGLYTNEWLLADIKTNEIAMFELGTHRSKLYRSSKNEWFGGTEGFYWGCNNTKDLDVRLETVASVQGRPANVVWRPSDRDKTWLQLFEKHKGKIDAGFGKLAFTTPPLAAWHSLDAKFTTTDLAKDLKTWALFGPPLGRSWQPTQEERGKYPEVRALASNPWTILHPATPGTEKTGGFPVVDLPKRVDTADEAVAKKQEDKPLPTVPAWHGTLLPRTDADIWLAAAFADYEPIVSRENALRKQAKDGRLTTADRDRLAVELYAHRSNYLAAARVVGDVPLGKTRAQLTQDEWYRIASGKGVLALHDLRQRLGSADFEKLMDDFGREFAGKQVTTSDFQTRAEPIGGKRLDGFFDLWMKQTGLPSEKVSGPFSGKEREKGPDTFSLLTRAPGGAFSILSFHYELDRSLIVYGTADEAPCNREAAEALQRAIIERHSNYTVPIKSDKEVTDADLQSHHLLLIGRPDCNTVVERFRAALPITFGTQSFTVRQETYAHAGSAVIAAGENPLNKRYSVVVLAGLSADAMLQAPPVLLRRGQLAAEVLVLPHDAKPRPLVVPPR